MHGMFIAWGGACSGQTERCDPKTGRCEPNALSQMWVTHSAANGQYMYCECEHEAFIIVILFKCFVYELRDFEGSKPTLLLRGLTRPLVQPSFSKPNHFSGRQVQDKGKGKTWCLVERWQRYRRHIISLLNSQLFTFSYFGFRWCNGPCPEIL